MTDPYYDQQAEKPRGCPMCGKGDTLSIGAEIPDTDVDGWSLRPASCSACGMAATVSWPTVGGVIIDRGPS